MAAGPAEVSADGRTVTVRLKNGLTWSDGEDLTAADFVLGIQRTCDPDNAGEYQFVLANVAGCDDYYAAAEAEDAEKAALREAVGVRALDTTTIEFTLLEPQTSFPVILSLWPTFPVPGHIVAGPADPWPAPQDLAFNGPFTVEDYTVGESMVFARNDAYAGAHLAYLDRVTFRYIEDASVANNAYRGGDVDMAQADVTVLGELASEFADELVSVATASTIGLQMRLDMPPLDNPGVRLALSRAIDRDTLIEVVLQDAHVPTTTWVVAGLLGLSGPDAFAGSIGFDPEAAREALAEAGYPGGEGFPALAILVRDSPENLTVAQFLQAAFAEHLGIEVAIDVTDGPTIGARLGQGQFQLLPGGFAQDYPDPENWILGRFETGGVANAFACSDPEIDALIGAARFNQDNAARLEQYAQINELVVTRLCGIAPLFHLGDHHLIAPNLHGARELSGPQNRVAAGDWAPEEWWLGP
jgi:oligopeptide transport system substrate-binding protein